MLPCGAKIVHMNFLFCICVSYDLWFPCISHCTAAILDGRSSLKLVAGSLSVSLSFFVMPMSIARGKNWQRGPCVVWLHGGGGGGCAKSRLFWASCPWYCGSSGIAVVCPKVWVGLAASCGSRLLGPGILRCPTMRLNNLTVRFQGGTDYRQPHQSASQLTSPERW